MKNLLIFLFGFMLLASCADPCEDEDNPIANLFAQKSTDVDFLSEVSFPSETHQYSFMMTEDGTFNCIGYQPYDGITAYTFQLEDQSGNTIMDVDLEFTSDTIEFIEVPQVALLQNEEYTLRRICSEYETADQLVGRVLKANNSPFGGGMLPLPLEVGSIIITDVYFAGGQGLSQNAIPYIDFGFTPSE